jgi:DNA polymerase-3 subunit epsilon
MPSERPPIPLGRKYALWLALLSLAALASMAAAGAVLWLDLKAHERDWLAEIAEQHGQLLVLGLLAVPAVLAGVLRLAFAAYPAALLKLAEQVRVIRSANPSHRIEAEGAAEVRQLAGALNQLAGAYVDVQQQVQARIDEANARLAQEKNQLAALMSELAQSVVVCNREGRILLYNPRATRLLAAGAGAEVPVGLGRSIFGILDRSPLLHAMGLLSARLEQGTADPVAHFVTTRGGQLLRAQMAPVPDGAGGMAGFVLVLEDITRSVENHARRDQLLQQLTEGSRPALANIRAAAETLQQYPDMDDARRGRFLEAIREEAQKLSDGIASALAGPEATQPVSWPREDMSAADLMAALRRSLPAGPELTWEVTAGPVWLSVDSYALVQALSLLAQRLATAFGLASLGLTFEAQGRWVRLSLVWNGRALDPQALHEWEDAPLGLGRAAPWTTVWQVLQQHGAEMWSQPAARGPQRLCLQLPAAQPEQVPEAAPAAPGRPVYYDFDLFGQPQHDSALDDRPLADLACTVFDTETTGISPSEGDEIIAIGAVRILNGRLLQQESFDRLVRPGRAVRRESQAVHGISQEMLANQPALEEVLPAFHRFAQETVLVGHNAAFDMRLLQLAQARTGLVFEQPVLDTLLLSALVHPGHADAEHRLEAIAARLGVPVVGRHTALGDALVTAEIFLKLIPLLAERGVRTLRQAREASQKTLYAQLEY